jgi:hypothetical protein
VDVKRIGARGAGLTRCGEFQKQFGDAAVD